MIIAKDEVGNLFAKFDVVESDLEFHPGLHMVNGHDATVKFIETLGSLENGGDTIDKIEQLFNAALQVGIKRGIELSKEKLLRVLE